MSLIIRIHYQSKGWCLHGQFVCQSRWDNIDNPVLIGYPFVKEDKWPNMIGGLTRQVYYG